jgi:hypothetical protein
MYISPLPPDCIIILTPLFAVCPLISTLQLPSFEEWKVSQGRSYASSSEEALARTRFEKNRAFAMESNSRSPALPYTLGMTQFADMDHTDFAKQFLRPMDMPSGSSSSSSSSVLSLRGKQSFSTLPASIDWDTKGLVSPVKNSQCAAVTDEFAGAVETAAAIAAGGQPSSFKELNEDQFGCDGCGCSCQIADVCGWAMKNGATFDFQANKCSYKPDVLISNCTMVTPDDDDEAMMTAIASQPVMVAIDASSNAFMLYTGGVLTDPSCSGTEINHVLLAVGYGVQPSKAGAGIAYYRARNSWGVNWGEKGYVRLGRGKNKGVGPAGECGFLSYALYPNVTLAQ